MVLSLLTPSECVASLGGSVIVIAVIGSEVGSEVPGPVLVSAETD